MKAVLCGVAWSKSCGFGSQSNIKAGLIRELKSSNQIWKSDRHFTTPAETMYSWEKNSNKSPQFAQNSDINESQLKIKRHFWNIATISLMVLNKHKRHYRSLNENRISQLSHFICKSTWIQPVFRYFKCIFKVFLFPTYQALVEALGQILKKRLWGFFAKVLLF